VLIVAAWCGLAAGLLEVGVRFFWRTVDPTNHLFLMSRHFVWIGPIVNLALFVALGTVLAAATRFWPRAGGWLSPRLICFFAVLPLLMVTSSRIYPIAWVILAIGIASLLAARFERNRHGRMRWLALSFPAFVLAVLVLVSLTLWGDWLKHRREVGHAVPTADSPNVLLIVLDTVRADRLSLHGYERPTSPNLERLARAGIRFDQARATAPWTLASHASFFTGRWPHELGVEWLTPLRANVPTLAAYLGSHGYATAGFVANTLYCSYETGLDRGFTHYEDYVLGTLPALRTAWLGDHGLKLISDLGLVASRGWNAGPLRVLREALFEPLFKMDRKKDAAAVNREFLDWFARRRQPDRPFFAFLNYYDAHAPYVLPPGAPYRFGLRPESQADFVFLVEHWTRLDKLSLPRRYQVLAQDCYDDCLAYLDDQLGELFRELERRGALERTVVIVTADHGEGLGEHGLFDHGESLYSTETRVPLVVVLPSRRPSGSIVGKAVSLRDLPATIVDLIGLGSASPFPGRSLARLWHDPRSEDRVDLADDVMSELRRPNPADPNRGRSPANRGPLHSLADGGFLYIWNEGDGTEELFDERDDSRELLNRARTPAMQQVVQRFRDRRSRFKDRPPPLAAR
jgi:arylsulfatase A-like enzyme